MGSTSQLAPWYVDLSRQVRQIIAEEVSCGGYQYLRGRGHHGARAVWDGRYRPNILFRPSCLPVQNKRNLNVGSTEIILLLGGVALNDDCLEKGIHFDYKRSPYRLVMGEKIRDRHFGFAVLEEFGRYFGFGKLQLGRGHYKQFVRRTLEILEDEISIFHGSMMDEFHETPERVYLAQKVRT